MATTSACESGKSTSGIADDTASISSSAPINCLCFAFRKRSSSCRLFRGGLAESVSAAPSALFATLTGVSASTSDATSCGTLSINTSLASSGTSSTTAAGVKTTGALDGTASGGTCSLMTCSRVLQKKAST